MKRERLKIVLLGPYPPTIGGVVTYMQYLLRSPLAGRYEFIECPTMSRKHGSADYTRETAGRKVFRVLKDFRNLAMILHREKPDLVHINSSFNKGAFERDALYLLLAKVFGKKVFHHFHGGRLDVFLQRRLFLIRLFIRLILHLPDRIAVLSEMQKAPFLSLGYNKKVVSIPNMIDSSLFGNFKRQESESVSVLMVASRFYREKGVFELVRVIPAVLKQYADTRFIFVGSGEEEGQMREICRKSGVESNVRFEGFLTNDEVRNVFQASDIFVLPSYSEGFPLVVLEAMAAGLPVVATTVGALPEMIETGVNGYLVPPRDESALLEALLQLVTDRQLRERMGHNNQRRVHMHYDSEIVWRMFDNVYRSLIHTQFEETAPEMDEP